MVMWKVILTKQANKDAKKLTAAGLKAQTETLLAILAENPYQPPSEKLKGDLSGYYSRRINIQHRLIYQIIPDERIVKVLRMWSHYE
ncbi:MAG: Txe/YoeB family addiction module toxin [Pseudanabaena sp. M135S2SP2A07QC]|jgi:Txe/YoeB family toxin of toxin-antitoxin system|nr:Txe/YoeB family addiction module toxin [Pseudanabaena sp. M090S1SP2A07QC]MCA6507872.1 Txe/YoeB family addiction module toxin [Pseudanabaena sp. M172S2SP2A07QC]MCA6517205.1 Txe/YoeB family addiction module toxin [Pseudanabaena sp. M110S1SP2A07QC]MCA6524215.1 Txe/YoeB family addiction module toxin [Pseudanabaena sp. M051S1SP2A07QC]MCA6527383.1 Txe/YoeB family addiction module toxin [Pseudanabaena sp. M179S2SP2A07QC]MCA6531989.1 Txe/YoeB family addiction module toxin [Pseudanabaena sp. M125S2S